MKHTLTEISNKLIELNDAYMLIYKDAYLAELAYTKKKAELMTQMYSQFTAQPARDAAVESALSITPEYIEYHRLIPDKNGLEMQIKIYMQLSRNIVASQWEGSA